MRHKPLLWVGSSRKDLSRFPKDVRRVLGQALDDAQWGGKHPDAKPFKGFTGAGVLEIVDDFDSDTYRAVYTVRFSGVIYALHAFQKKSKKGIETPRRELDLIRRRYKMAEQHFKARRRPERKDKETR